MEFDDLELTDGANAGSWIEPGLGGEFGAVTLQVPKSFEAYARIFHPARDREGNPVRWAEVAVKCGTVPHEEMQWHAIVGRPVPPTNAESKWQGQEPWEGEMDIPVLDALCEVLAAHTADPNHCFFGLCTINSWEDAFSKAELRSHRLLRLPMGRDHIILAGPLSAVTEVDFDSTLVGGSSELVEAIVASPKLEAWRVEPATSLAAGADKVNVPSSTG